jgi:hypothetical protein
MSTKKGTQTPKGRATEETRPPAAGGAASREDSEPFVLPVLFTIDHLIGRDPDALPKYRRAGLAAVRSSNICESLFWVVQQLGNMVNSDGWVYSKNDLAGALDCIGEVGKAVAEGASAETQHLEFAAERLYKGEEE